MALPSFSAERRAPVRKSDLLRWIPGALWLRSAWLCRRGHERVPTWTRHLGADWPTGFYCPRCSRASDLDGGFIRWIR